MKKHTLLLMAGIVITLIGIWGGSWLTSIAKDGYEFASILTALIFSVVGVWVTVCAMVDISMAKRH